MTSLDESHQTVLVVEDDGLVRFDTAETLRDAGFEVLEAGDAVEALAEVEQRGDIRLLFTDINMPGEMDGIQLARKVHQLHPAIQVLLTSGKVRPRNGEFPDDGDFIAKPYSAASMTRAVCRMLA